MQEKLKQQDVNHAQLQQEHRLRYGMLVQVCQKGFQGLKDSARTSKHGSNITAVARGNKKKFAPDVVDDAVDATVDVANDAVDAVEDAANAVYDTVADLPADVADWTLEQLEGLKSLVGLHWTDIPGLSDAIEEVEQFAVDSANSIVDAALVPINAAIDAVEIAVDEVEDFAVETVDAAIGPISDAMDDLQEFAVAAVNSALDIVTDWVSVLERELKSVTSYVTDLYNKYLKPIITMIWECAKNAKSPQDFIICAIKPVLEKLMQSLVPLGSVSAAIPFPFDDEALSLDPETGVYTMKQTCFDCVEGDMRDLAPLRCDMKEFDFLSIFKVTAHACNVPFMPGQCGGSLPTCLKKKATECSIGAIMWGSESTMTKLSAPIQEAMTLFISASFKVAQWTSEARTLWEELKASASSAASAVQDVLSNIMNGVDSIKAAKDAVISCLQTLGKFTSAKSVLKMIPMVERLIENVEETISAIETAQASVEAVQTGVSGLSSSTQSDVQSFFLNIYGKVQEMKNDIETTKNDLLDLYQNSKGVAEELVAEFVETLSTPLDQLQDLGSFVQNCATARTAYQKVYVDLEVATVTAGRVALHERDGVKLAYIQPNLGSAKFIKEEWPWSELQTHEGQDLELCVFVYCAKFNIKVRKNPSNILGIPIEFDDNLDMLKWFELEYKELSYNLNVIGIPYKFADPTGIRLPSVALPFLLQTTAPAAPPTVNLTEASQTLTYLVTANEFIASIHDLLDDPVLPEEAASSMEINEVKAEVDQGIDLEGTSPQFEEYEVPWKAFTKITLKHCKGDTLSNEVFSSVSEAKERCLELSTCLGVYDQGCNESPNDVFLCDTAQISIASLHTSSGSCVYQAPGIAR